MRSLVLSIPFLALTANAASGQDNEHVLHNSHLRIVVDLRSGSIAELQDLDRPDQAPIVTSDDAMLTLASGEFGPWPFFAIRGDSTSVTMVSPAFRFGPELMPLVTTILYRLRGPRISVDYSFEAVERIELFGGLHIDVSGSSWDSLLVRNHFSGEAPIAFGQTDTVRYLALNQIYELHDADRRLTLLFPNPYHGLVRVSTTMPDRFLMRCCILVGTHPFGAADIHGHPLTSVLVPGIELHRQLELIVNRRDDERLGDADPPIAYFSPFPDGYDQVIAMTFDDIPFWCWSYPKSSDDPNAQFQKYLIRLLEDHPRMKMGWIILLDKILHDYQLATPEYPAGKWWRAHGKYRLLTEAPGQYRQWIRNIDRDSLIYGYEDRVHLGSHGYHHTPEMEFGDNWEFQYYDPAFNDSTFRTIVEEYRRLGLSEKSRRWIRFPGFHFTDATVKALIKYGFVFFDYWGVFNKLPWMLFYSEHGRIWGAGTWWSGDIPLSYDDMNLLLRDGKLCHTCGHPGAWFDGDPEAAYAEINGIFQRAENDYPNLGYLFPDDVGYFAHETYDIGGFDIGVAGDHLILHFIGSAEHGQTIVIEWPSGVDMPAAATVDNLPVTRIEHRGRRLILILPELSDGSHLVRVPYGSKDEPDAAVPPASFALYQNYPNPFNASTTIGYYVPDGCPVTLEIFDGAGNLISRLLEDRPTEKGFHAMEWRGIDDTGDAVSSGVYFCRLTACGVTASRKIVLVR